MCSLVWRSIPVLWELTRSLTSVRPIVRQRPRGLRRTRRKSPPVIRNRSTTLSPWPRPRAAHVARATPSGSTSASPWPRGAAPQSRRGASGLARGAIGGGGRRRAARGLRSFAQLGAEHGGSRVYSKFTPKPHFVSGHAGGVLPES